MTRLLLGLALPLTALFALALGGLHLIPGSEAVSAAFSDCAMPCWQGLEPGVTAHREALTRLKAAGWTLDSQCNAAVYELCYAFVRENRSQMAFVYVAREQVMQVALLRFGLALGDVWLTFGAPDYAALPVVRLLKPPSFDTALWFGGSGVSARIGFPCPAGFQEMLRAPVMTLLVWARGTAMQQGTTPGSVADLRRALRQYCSG